MGALQPSKANLWSCGRTTAPAITSPDKVEVSRVYIKRPGFWLWKTFTFSVFTYCSEIKASSKPPIKLHWMMLLNMVPERFQNPKEAPLLLFFNRTMEITKAALVCFTHDILNLLNFFKIRNGVLESFFQRYSFNLLFNNLLSNLLFWRCGFQRGVEAAALLPFGAWEEKYWWLFRLDCQPFECASICSSEGAYLGGRGREYSKYQVASPKRAAAGGRRSQAGMPWSGRREDEAARWFVEKWKWDVEAAEKFRREGEKFSPTLDHATPGSPPPCSRPLRRGHLVLSILFLPSPSPICSLTGTNWCSPNWLAS